MLGRLGSGSERVSLLLFNVSFELKDLQLPDPCGPHPSLANESQLDCVLLEARPSKCLRRSQATCL